MPVLTPDHVAAATLLRLRPRLDFGDRRSQDPVLDRLPVLVQELELGGEPLCLLGVGRQQQLERGVGAPEPAGGVDPRREPEPDGRGVDGGGVDPGVLHQRLKARPLCPGERAQPGDRERAVLVEQRDDVGDRGERDQVEIRRDIHAERLRELADDTGAAELRERIVRRARRDDRAVRQGGARAVVIGDDHVEAARLRSRDLLDRCDPAVDGNEQAAAFVGEPRDRDVRDAVALLEAARQMPLDVGAERAQRQNGERRGADAVHVVVAVDADPLAGGDCRVDPVDRNGHVPEQERIVWLDLAGDERARLLEVAVAAPDENRRRDLPEVERIGERADVGVVTVIDRPGAVLHGQSTVRARSDGSRCSRPVRPCPGSDPVVSGMVDVRSRENRCSDRNRRLCGGESGRVWGLTPDTF